MGSIVRADRADLCLEFVNTKFWRGRDPVTETLKSPAALLDWCARNGALDAETATRLAAQWKRQKQAAARLFEQAVALRESLFPLFAAIAGGEEPPAGDLAELNRWLEQAPQRRRLTRLGDAYAWQVDVLPRAAPALLAAVLWSAGDLIAGTTRRDRVRICANPVCRWLFLDDSKSGTRRWCSMSACGNRAKAHRHYLKQKGE